MLLLSLSKLCQDILICYDMSYWHELADCLIWWIWPTLLRIWSIFAVIIVVLAFLVNILALFAQHQSESCWMSVIASCALVTLGHHFLDILWGGHLAEGYLFEVFKFDFAAQNHGLFGVISRWKFLQTLTGAGTPAIFPSKGKRASCSLTFLHYDSRPVQGFWEDAKIKDPRHTLVDNR